MPVAGLDRMVLTDQPAVADLLALADALLLPEDDLTFACVLTSPLGGLSDDEPDGAGDRPPAARCGTRCATARRGTAGVAGGAGDSSPPCWRRVDYATPHALFAEALGPLGGRARLFARLGPEAAEPVDELLARRADLQPRRIRPSLQGFLHWLRRSAAEVKREQEAAGGRRCGS